jgi:hypothetical protein
MTAKNLETRLSALERAASSAKGFDPERYALLRKYVTVAAFHAGGWQSHESEAQAFARALNLDAASLKRKLAEEPITIWAEVHDLVATFIASKGMTLDELHAAALGARKQ